MLGRWLERLARWYLARRVRNVVGVAVTLPPVFDASTLAPSVPANPYRDRFEIRRNVNGESFSLYDGPSGGDARRWFEHVKREREPGTMEFWHNGTRRDWWPR